MLDLLSHKDRPWIENLTLIAGSFLDLDLGSEVYDAFISSMVLHHWIPRVKLDLYSRIHRALLPNGVFVNGDYIVSGDESSRRLAEAAKVGLEERHQIHIDLPLSFDQELQLLAQTGFVHATAPFRRSKR